MMSKLHTKRFRIALALSALLFLTACEPDILGPDARLPDGSTYAGDTKDGFFHGYGVQTFPSGDVYKGEFQNGYWHGVGVFESASGWRYEGEFEKGEMSGKGVYEDEDSRYEGAFKNGEFNGKGRYEYNGNAYQAMFEDGKPVMGKHINQYGIYTGEFKDWYYHGEGTYIDATEGSGTRSGTWEDGVFVDWEEIHTEDTAAQEPRPLLTEQILTGDRQRLLSQIDALAAERPGQIDAYFLAVGGDGTESVFMRDIQVAKLGLSEHFEVENRSIMLLNHRDYEAYPLATRPSMAKALNALDNKMNAEEDLLVIHLVSHGGRDGDLLLQQPDIELPNLSPEDFAEMLGPLNTKRKLVVVSACYSGHWIEALKDDNTLIMTSSRDDRTSFGCGDDSEMTWFTKAVYKSVGLSLNDPAAMFDEVTSQIRSWEEEIDMEEERWSYPQIHVGEQLKPWLTDNYPKPR